MWGQEYLHPKYIHQKRYLKVTYLSLKVTPQLKNGQQKLGKSVGGNSEGQSGDQPGCCAVGAQDSGMAAQWGGTRQAEDLLFFRKKSKKTF